MREDMSKVLVERPRVGGCGKRNARNNRHQTRQICKDIPFEEDLDTPDFRGMKRVHTSKPNSFDDKKELNENLRPLRRFLDSKIGQKWDDVYSEIMSGINLNNAVQYHVWQHLIQGGEVQTKTYMEGSTVMAAGVIGPEEMTTSYGREEFYVDPRDGTLRKTSRKKHNHYRRLERSKNDSYCDPKNPLTQYHKVKNVWYEFKLRAATAEETKQKSFGENVHGFKDETKRWEWKWRPLSDNKFVNQIIENREGVGGYHYYNHDKLWWVCEELFGGAYLPTAKRQISSKEVRKVEELMEERNRKLSRKAA